MPDLPRLSIDNQGLYDRAVAAFPGDTLAEKAAAYRRFSLRSLAAEVLRLEAEHLTSDYHAAMQAKRVELAAISDQIA